MPQYTHDDRVMLQTEAELWAVLTILNGINHEGEWATRIKAAASTIQELAAEIRDYNDEWEEE